MINADDEVSLAYLLDPTFQLVNTAGKPLTDGWIEVYIHGTRNKYYCYKDFDKEFMHEFKIPLDSLGANIILASPAHAYDVYVYNKFGSLVMSRYNVVPATGDGAVIKDVVTITSKDGTVDVTTSNQTDWDLSIKDTVDRVEANTTEIVQIKEDVANTKTDLTNLTEVVNGHTTEIGQIKEDVAGIESSLTNKKDKQTALSFNGSATKTVKTITQNANGELTVEFEDIDLPQEVPNVEITSKDNSVQVTETTDVVTNTKKFDLSVNVNDPLEYGQFRATNVISQAQLNKVNGNIELNNYAIKLKKGNSYHFTVRGSYVANSAVNTNSTIVYIEPISFNNINVNVDNTITDSQFFEISYDVYKLSSDKNYNVAFSSMSDGKVSELLVEVHNLNGVSINGQGGGGDNDKVAVDADAEPGYLENVLVSDSDIVSLVKLGNVLHVQVNTDDVATKEDLNNINSTITDLSNDITNIGVWEDITSKFSPTSAITHINGFKVKFNRAIGLLYFRIDVNGNFNRTSNNVSQQLFTKNSSDISTLKFDAIFGLFSRTGTTNKEVPYQLGCNADGIYGWLPADGVNAGYILVSSVVPFTE